MRYFKVFIKGLILYKYVYCETHTAQEVFANFRANAQKLLNNENRLL